MRCLQAAVFGEYCPWILKQDVVNVMGALQVCVQGPLGFCKAEGRSSHFNLWLKRALGYYVTIKGREFWKALRAHQARMVSET